MEATAAAPATAQGGPLANQPDGRPIRRLEDDPRYAVYPFVIDQASPTLITLQLRPRAEAFPTYTDFLKVAEECGFVFPWTGPQLLGLISRDTRKPIALFRDIGGGQWGKPIQQVVIQIDPEACLIEESAGQRLVDCWLDLAEALNADTLDGVGNLVKEEALQALGDHIGEVISRRYVSKRTASSIRLPDGSLRFPGLVSFQHMTYTKPPGKRLSRRPTIENFDVPALPYYAAKAHALRMVEELKRNYAEHEFARPSFIPMIAAVLEAEAPRVDMRDGVALRENVSACFLEVLSTVFKVGLMNINPKWLTENAKRNDEWAAEEAERLATKRLTEKRDFSERMHKAKAAKKAARKAAAS